MLLNISRSEIERARLESEFKGQMDRQIMEGKLEKAKRESERKGVEQTVRNALTEGASIEFVQRITGLTFKPSKPFNPNSWTYIRSCLNIRLAHHILRQTQCHAFLPSMIKQTQRNFSI